MNPRRLPDEWRERRESTPVALAIIFGVSGIPLVLLGFAIYYIRHLPAQ
jgi:hypothetical protein